MSGKDALTSENGSGNDVGTPLVIDWEQRLRDAVEETLRAKAKRKAERAEFKRRRDWGLTQRYARKTARNQEETP